MELEKPKGSFLALTPLLLFMCLYLGFLTWGTTEIPICIAFLISSIYAIAITGKKSLDERIALFCQGASDRNLLTMIWIFILAGAFASAAKSMGAVDATVYATLKVLPDGFLLPGLFLAACFISLSIGTSVGTIVALTPMAMGMAEQTHSSIGLLVAVVVGGAYFGDNLSFISDTTIVATKSQGCSMKDKFKVNCYITIPVAVILLIVYIIMGREITADNTIQSANWISTIPYISILVLAICGLNVMLVLPIGILLTGIIGISTGCYDLSGWMETMSQGILGMSELIIVTLLAGGMLGLIRHNGGLEYLTEKITKHVKSKKGGEVCIALLTIFSDLCTANNTIAIITTGPIAKEISDRYQIDKRRSASLLDTFSCFAQGLIPYGAQLLIAAKIANIQPTDILSYLYYPMLLGIVAFASIFLRFPRKYA